MQRRDDPLNPYDFVPLEGQPSFLRPRPDQSRATGLYGTIRYTISALTPLCVQHSPGDRNVALYRFANLDGRPVLPATSLKGMLRSVHEVVTNSTMGLISTRDAFYMRRIPQPYLPGVVGRELTPSEALFGMVGGEGDRDPDAVGYAGRVLIDDLPIAVALTRQPVSRPQGGQPKPAHESFYFASSPDGPILGRKFYYHQRDVAHVREVYRGDRRQGGRGMPEIFVEAVPAGATLSGVLRFTGLAREELAALVYSLILEDGLAHKLGYGKPLGLGSLRITIDSLVVEAGGEADPRRRFLQYDAPAEGPADERFAPARLRDEARSAWLERPQGRASYEAFTTIAAWPGVTDYLYPDFGFFRGERGRPDKLRLWEYQGRGETERYPAPRRRAPAPDAAASPARQEDPGPQIQAAPTPSEVGAGTLDRDAQLGYVVRDGELTYRVNTSGATNKLLKRLADRVLSGEQIRVRFKLEPQLSGPVAYDLELAPEGE